MEAMLVSVAVYGGRLLLTKLMERLKERKFEAAHWGGVETSKEGTQVWRINQFKANPMPEEEFGTFYSGDTYLILNIHKKESSSKLGADIYIWIGGHSTADEYGTAAYKMVELDETKFGGMARQHREQQGFESKKFLGLFPVVSILNGGHESGFNKFENRVEPKLFVVTGYRASVKVEEKEYSYSHVNFEDVFIVDKGSVIYQLNGANSNKDERHKASQVIAQLKSFRGNCRNVVIDDVDDNTNEEIITELKSFSKDDGEKVNPNVPEEPELYSLWKISNESGDFVKTCVKREKASLDDFESKDVFLYETSGTIFVWVGSTSEKEEKLYGICLAEEFLSESKRKKVPIQLVNQGNETKSFTRCLQ